FDKVVFQQHFQLMQKTEGTAGRYLFFELTHGLQSGVLGAQHRAVEVDQGGYLVFHGGHEDHFYPFLLVVEGNIGVDAIPYFGSVLFQDAGLFDDLYEGLGAAVNNGDLRSVDLNQAIVHTHPYQAGQDVLDGTDLGPIVFEGRSPGSVRDKVTIRLDHRL